MATKTSSANPMTATDRRAFLQKVTAALGFMPLAGCSLDSEGIALNNLDDDPDEQQPFEGPPVSLKIESLKPAPFDVFNLHVKFVAEVEGVGERTHENVIKNTDVSSLPYTLTDPYVIAISESGSVSCTCTFQYDDGTVPDTEVIGPALGTKSANVELPAFKLFFGDTGYALSWESP